MSKKTRTGMWLLCGFAAVAMALVMSPWSVLACAGAFAVSIAVSMHKDEEKADEADD